MRETTASEGKEAVRKTGRGRQLTIIDMNLEVELGEEELTEVEQAHVHVAAKIAHHIRMGAGVCKGCMSVSVCATRPQGRKKINGQGSRNSHSQGGMNGDDGNERDDEV